MQPPTKKIFGNTAALLIIQLANYLLPFVLTPYLSRTLGISEYGAIALGLSIIQIACIITDYGFSISATYLTSKAQNKQEVNEIAGAVYSCKTILLIPVLALITAFPFISEKYTEYRAYFWLISISVIGISFQPTWLFQGLEKMKLITIYTVLARVTLIFSTLIFVTKQEESWIFAICNGSSQIIAAVISICSLRKIGYKPAWRSWAYTFSIFKRSTEYFWSRAAVGIYGTGSTFILGMVSTPAQVAYYAIAEQFYRGAISFYNPLTQSLYPHMAKYRDIKRYKTIFSLAMALGATGITIGIVFGKSLISIIFGTSYEPAYSILVIFMIALVAAIPSIMLGYPLLGALGNSKAANHSVIYAGLLQTILIIFCVATKHTNAINIVITVLITEFFAFSYRAFLARKILKSIDPVKHHAQDS